MSDWTGNSNSIFKTLGASNHCDYDRAEYDFYATWPEAVKALLSKEIFSKTIWEPAAGEGHISEVLKDHAYEVISSDLIQRNYPLEFVSDFLSLKRGDFEVDSFPDIVTNPPYKYATEFIQKALELADTGSKIAMFLKLTFLEGGKRYKELFELNPPKRIWVFSQRVPCARNGEFNKEGKGKAVCYAWFIWEKGYKGNPEIGWIYNKDGKNEEV